MQAPAVLLGEVQMRQYLLRRIREQVGRLGEALAQNAGHLRELGHGAFVVGLGEHGADERGDGLLRRLRHGGKEVLGLPALTAGSPQSCLKIR